MEQLTYDIINKLCVYINKPSNKNKLEKDVLAPLFNTVVKNLYPYIIGIAIIHMIIIGLLLYILKLLNIKNSNYNI